MSFIAAALIGGGVALIGGMMASDAAGDAADVQAGAARDSSAVQKQISDQQIALQREQFEYQKGLQAPYRRAGEQALNKLIPLTDYRKFGMDQFQEDPGYAFRLSEGQKALERQAAARGGLISGGALKAATRYGQEMGSQEYTNAFNRYQTERAAQLQPLQSLAGVGQTSAQTLGNAGQAMTAGISSSLGNYGNAASEAIGAAGQARASGYVGQANALTGALSSGTNMYMQGQMMNRLFPGTPRYGAFGGGSGTFGEGQY
jgi:hypothetical protein